MGNALLIFMGCPLRRNADAYVDMLNQPLHHASSLTADMTWRKAGWPHHQSIKP